MNLSEYQEWTKETAIYPKESQQQALSYVTLGLVGEAGEVANKVKKVIRDDGGVVSSEKTRELQDEIGDVFWYLARLCDELGLGAEDVIEWNKTKLSERKEKGTLSGSGDTR